MFHHYLTHRLKHNVLGAQENRLLFSTHNICFEIIIFNYAVFFGGTYDVCG